MTNPLALTAAGLIRQPWRMGDENHTTRYASLDGSLYVLCKGDIVSVHRWEGAHAFHATFSDGTPSAVIIACILAALET